ncbi:hypothetical protein ACFSTA_20500 [Ornithinibacillus salinisoli]|uniref:Uncharacterized protein n=1 Tax=Ornithinibacillus salinisoli TaxID=1848459 RepID=A0ABW4W5F1_9BACI
MGRRKIRNVRSSGNNNNSVAGVNNSNNNNSVAGATDEVIYTPTKNVVNTVKTLDSHLYNIVFNNMGS